MLSACDTPVGSRSKLLLDGVCFRIWMSSQGILLTASLWGRVFGKYPASKKRQRFVSWGTGTFCKIGTPYRTYRTIGSGMILYISLSGNQNGVSYLVFCCVGPSRVLLKFRQKTNSELFSMFGRRVSRSHIKQMADTGMI